MQARTRITLGLATTALALSSGLGLAAAAVKDGASPPSGPTAGGPPGGPPGGAAIASYLGLTASQIQSDLKGGETLAQIATAQGKTADGLEAAIVADAKSHLDAELSAGTITAAQESTMLSDLQSHVADLVNSTGPPAGGRGGPGGPGGSGGPGNCPPPGGATGSPASSGAASSSSQSAGATT